MEAGQIGLTIQLVVLLVVEEYNRIREAVLIHHQMKLGCFVLENLTMRSQKDVMNKRTKQKSAIKATVQI
jgi:hypothetical protein